MTARTRADYEETLLKEIKDFPESELGKVLKMVHFLKEEIFGTENEKREDLELCLFRGKCPCVPEESVHLFRG